MQWIDDDRVNSVLLNELFLLFRCRFFLTANASDNEFMKRRGSFSGLQSHQVTYNEKLQVKLDARPKVKAKGISIVTQRLTSFSSVLNINLKNYLLLHICIQQWPVNKHSTMTPSSNNISLPTTHSVAGRHVLIKRIVSCPSVNLNNYRQIKKC